MKASSFSMIGSWVALALAGSVISPPPSYGQSIRQEARGQGVEELTRGPIHEAFAETVNFDPQPGIVIPSQPPDMIEEIPPDQKPVGDHVVWIPGYWGWEEDAEEFIWISGVWRNLPPARQWLPGYWTSSGWNWQWISGYWADEALEEVVYLPKPPKTLETGPNIQPPSENHLWISGSWIYRNDDYAWRPGYWEPARENWIWVPDHYQWTPLGYIFVDGYWDYQLARRGVLFAPLRVSPVVYQRPGYFYRPTTVIHLDIFTDHVFVRPDYGHYYFGDYYAPRYRDLGFFASFAYHSTRGYDPIYAHTRWEHRRDRDWERLRRERFEYFRANEDARPPRTWAAMKDRSGDRKNRRDDVVFAQPLEDYARAEGDRPRFESVTDEDRENMKTKRGEVREFSKDRQKRESRIDESIARDDKKVKREKLAKSPLISGKRAEATAAAGATPGKEKSGREETRAAEKADSQKNDPRRNSSAPERTGKRSQDTAGLKKDTMAQKQDLPAQEDSPPPASGKPRRNEPTASEERSSRKEPAGESTGSLDRNAADRAPDRTADPRADRRREKQDATPRRSELQERDRDRNPDPPAPPERRAKPKAEPGSKTIPEPNAKNGDRNRPANQPAPGIAKRPNSETNESSLVEKKQASRQQAPADGEANPRERSKSKMSDPR
jgi:hypothetical protein